MTAAVVAKPSGALRAWFVHHAAPRRMVMIPFVCLLMAVAAVVVPVVCAVNAPFALRPRGRGRAIRAGIFLIIYLGAEIVGLIWCAVLWLTLGAGRRAERRRYEDANYALIARVLTWLHASATTLFNVRFAVPETVDHLESERSSTPRVPAGPIIVLSRHGGPGDSLLIVHALLVRAGRRPRIVLKDTLRFDPFIDVVLSRLPNAFIRPNPDSSEDVAQEIADLAVDLGSEDALVLFPEGGNFTPGRRRRAIAKLRRRGLRESARRAEQLPHVLPPRPAGVFAAIDANPETSASVVFVAHTGLDHMESVVEVWQSVPLTAPAEATWWSIPATRVPTDPEARLRWLHDNWAEVDAWIDRHRIAGEETVEISERKTAEFRVRPASDPVKLQQPNLD